MSLTQITDRLWVSSQPDVEDFKSYRDQGFLSLVNVRPEGEEQSQPGNDVERRASESAGLDYTFIPVSMTSITEADIQAFGRAMTEASGKVLAHCKSGTRALILYVLGEVIDGRMKDTEVLDYGRKRGFDVSMAETWLRNRAAKRPEVKGFFDPRTWSVQYVVSDPDTGKCAIIDPVLDFDEKSGATATKNADAILDYIAARNLKVEWILDTHPHADHFSAAQYLKAKTGAPTAIGDRVVDVQKLWKGIYNWPSLPTDGSQWDKLLADGEEFTIGSITGRAMFSPGHTLASVTYVIGEAAFIHDTLFQPDSGTTRADFPGGDAKALWNSMWAILRLPDETRLFTGHDYQPHGREPKWESTVGEQKRSNEHVVGIDEAEFIRLRTARDSMLPMPKLILHALQVNIRGGRLPEPEGNGRRYLKFPLDALEGSAW
ncbi:MAG: blh [Rhizobium sp.]|nr:blh [Rhizobium sp.]